MPEDNLYSAYLAGGEAEGAYASGIHKVQDAWSKIDYGQRLASAKQDKLSRGVDTIGAALQLGSTAYGGWQDKRKFEGESLPAAQKIMAERAYDPEEHGGIKWDKFQESDKYEDYLGGFTPKKVEMSAFESLFADQPSYMIGDEEFKKSDISLMGQFAGSERLSEILGTEPSNVMALKQSMLEETERSDDKTQNLQQNIKNIPKVKTTIDLSKSKQTLSNVGNQPVVQSQGGPVIGGYQDYDTTDLLFGGRYKL